MRRAVWVCALAGCDSVFGLSPTKPLPDALAKDAQFFDAPLDAACTTARIDVEADGTIIGASPTLPLTGGTLMNLAGPGAAGTGLDAHGLFRFDLSGLPPAPYYSLTLVLHYATHDDACSAGCGSCAGLEHAGAFDVFAMTSTWTEPNGAERGATWNCRSGTTSGCPGTAWNAPGAQGGGDRGVKVATFQHAAGQDSSAVIGGLGLQGALPWIAGTHLTLQVVPDPLTGTFIVRCREHTCDAGQPAAQLVAAYCH
jgi:hypothetical protein